MKELPWDKEWMGKSRDDMPLSDQPMPENPLLKLARRPRLPILKRGSVVDYLRLLAATTQTEWRNAAYLTVHKLNRAYLHSFEARV